jgi:flagellar biosynthesis chaperone FliJ
VTELEEKSRQAVEMMAKAEKEKGEIEAILREMEGEYKQYEKECKEFEKMSL